MKIIKLEYSEFDNYSKNHILHTYYQSSNYGELMRNYGYEPQYYGFTNDNNELIGASLILTKKLFLGYKYCIIPGTILINYEDNNLVGRITIMLKKLLLQNNVIALKVEATSLNSINKVRLLETMEANGYSFHNNHSKAKYDAILNIHTSTENLYNACDRSIKIKLQTAKRFGVEIIPGDDKSMNVFYKLVKENSSYHKCLKKSFQKNYNTYFIRLDTKMYLENAAKAYKYQRNKKDIINNKLLKKLQDRSKIVQAKIVQDKLFSTSQNALKKALNIAKNNPNGIIIGACATITDNKEVVMICNYKNRIYNSVSPNHFLKWAIIQDYANRNFRTFRVEKIDRNEAIEMQKYNAEIIEHPGHFVLVTNKLMYKIFNKILK